MLYEDETFPERKLAALVLAKVYYHLQEYTESMAFALGAGDLFQLHGGGEFEETIISKCVDTYITLSSAKFAAEPERRKSTLKPAFASAEDEAAASNVSTTPFSQSQVASKSLLSRASTENLDESGKGAAADNPAAIFANRKTLLALDAIIERIFSQCMAHGRYRQVVGIAIEARSLLILKRVMIMVSEEERITGGSQTEELLDYILNVCMDVVQERSLRKDILRLVLEMLTSHPKPDFFAITKCAVYLDAYDVVANMLKAFVEKGDKDSQALAYQIAFDIHDNATQLFLTEVNKLLPTIEKPEPAPAQNGDEKPEDASLLANQENNDEVNAIINKKIKAYKEIRYIMDGYRNLSLNLDFLYRNNKTDRTILQKVKSSLESRNSIFHTAVALCHAFMNAGTANDKFLGDNKDWTEKAINWSRFSTTATLGVIHKGNLKQAKTIFRGQIPSTAGGHVKSAYSYGGALYGYGLIYANHGTAAMDFLMEHFQNATDPVVQHGGALGLGVAGMGSSSDAVCEALKTVLYQDQALNGEAVGLSMGLTMLGSGNTKVLEEMIQYAHETQHEKTVRGLALGMSMIMFGRQESADELIDGLLADADPTLRYGGIMTIAMAYCGTSSNKAVRKLLHVAVSDVNDDVRRIAVMSLGFILFRKPSSVPRMVELLSESYNPHVRYGAAMALGISCAGTGLDEAIDLLEPMIKDPTDFVRQGALMALSMIMIQQNEAMNPKVTTVRATLKKIISNRHEDAMTKFGCSLATGILDAGGRNSTIALQTSSGNLNMPGIVGMAVFVQYWYWFPFAHMLCLSFQGTGFIGLNADLEMPEFSLHCQSKEKLWEYPPEGEKVKEEVVGVVKTAVLSTTAQAKRRAAKKRGLSSVMDVDNVTSPKPTTSDKKEEGDKMDVDDEEKKEADAAEAAATKKEEAARKKAEREKIGFEVSNMTRVLPAQLKYLSFPPNSRYKPVKPLPTSTGGGLGSSSALSSSTWLLIDTRPQEEKKLVTPSKIGPSPSAASGPAGAAGLTNSTPARAGDGAHGSFAQQLAQHIPEGSNVLFTGPNGGPLPVGNMNELAGLLGLPRTPEGRGRDFVGEVGEVRGRRPGVRGEQDVANVVQEGDAEASVPGEWTYVESEDEEGGGEEEL